MSCFFVNLRANFNNKICLNKKKKCLRWNHCQRSANGVWLCWLPIFQFQISGSPHCEGIRVSVNSSSLFLYSYTSSFNNVLSTLANAVTRLCVLSFSSWNCALLQHNSFSTAWTCCSRDETVVFGTLDFLQSLLF